MAENQEVSQETTEPVAQEDASNGLPIEGQQPEAVSDGAAESKQATQTQQPQQAAQTTDGSTPEWWKPDLFQLKYRGATVSPKDYNHAINLMQKGWSYESAMAEVKREKDAIEANKARYEQYERLDKAFKENPAFAQRIQQLHQETVGARSQAPQSVDPQYATMMQDMGAMKEEFNRIKQEREDNAVAAEIADLRAKYPDTKFDAITESGHPLLWDILNHAHSNKMGSLHTAYRDYMFDTIATTAKMQGAEQVAQQRQANVRKGVVSSGSPKPATTVQPQDVRAMSYDRIADLAKKELGLVT